jgi:thioredoxin 1
MEVVLYIILTIVGFFIVLQSFIWLSSILKKGKSAPELGGEIGTKMEAGKKLLFYFYSPSCGACRTMTPVVD